MPRSRLPVLVAVLLAALVLVAGVAPSAAQDDPGAEVPPEGAATESVPPPLDASPEVAVDGGAEAGLPPVGAQASGLDRLAQLLTAPRPLRLPMIPPDEEPPPPSGPPYKTGPAADSPVVIPPPALPPGDGTVYAVGDSVLLGTKDYLATTVGGWDLRLDARVGRRFPEGIDLVRTNRDRIGQAVVICLGHNYGGGGYVYGYLDELMAELRNVPRVVFVTVAEWSPAQPEVNRAIRALPAFYPNVVVADWQAVSAANPPFLAGDRVHLTRSGNIALANLIAVMLGPASRDGTTVAPPRILDIPVEGPVAPTPTSTSTTSTTSTTAPPGSTTTTAPPDTTTTTGVESTTTTTAPAPSSTTSSSQPP